MRKGRYYLARVIKLGELHLNKEKLLCAIADAPVIAVGQFEWTITDVIDKRSSAKPYIFGKLSKFSQQGQVAVVDELVKRQLKKQTPNLLGASAPFVYLPDFSGLAYLHVWNGIEKNVFERRFKSIIEEACDNFFVDCGIEPVADYRAFLQKLQSMDRIAKLSAKVYPPNPLFGRLWRSLDRYVKKRNAEEVSVREATDKPEGLLTQIPVLINNILENSKYEPIVEPDITDAALLMAADGYGRGKAVGTENGREVVVRTSESQKSFLFDKSPDPEALSIATRREFEIVSKERDMRH